MTPERRAEILQALRDQPGYLTDDPAVAAQPWGQRDYGWEFPYGRHWAITAENALGLYRHKFLKHFRDDGQAKVLKLASDELFHLRLELLFFEWNVDDPRWTDGERGRALCAFLMPGREDWGGAEGGPEFA